MAINIENLIDLSLLQQYDKNLKEWVTNNFYQTVQFLSKDAMPLQGEKNILYVTEDSILYWDGSQFVKLSSSSSGDEILWKSF